MCQAAFLGTFKLVRHSLMRPSSLAPPTASPNMPNSRSPSLYQTNTRVWLTGSAGQRVSRTNHGWRREFQETLKPWGFTSPAAWTSSG